MAEHRKRLKEAGLLQSTIWLSKDDEVKLSEFMQVNQISTKSEAIQKALRLAFTEDEMEMRA
jgi:hypothetical protein